MPRAPKVFGTNLAPDLQFHFFSSVCQQNYKKVAVNKHGLKGESVALIPEFSSSNLLNIYFFNFKFHCSKIGGQKEAE